MRVLSLTLLDPNRQYVPTRSWRIPAQLVEYKQVNLLYPALFDTIFSTSVEEFAVALTLPSADRFEDEIANVTRIILEERKQGRLSAEAIVDNKLVKLPMRGRAIFVGDIHGELQSVNEILIRTDFAKTQLEPDKRGYIVFLGDLIDRGENSIEVLSTLFTLKILFKENVILLKGNHELPDVNSRYGFIDEVRRKYPRDAREIYESCNGLFEKFPHAVITANGIFAVHGGIPEDVTSLRQVSELDGKELEQLLWNDPRPEIKGFEQNYERDPMGLSTIRYFGNDVTTRFLDGIGAKVLLRAHEYFKGSGYMALSQNVLTVFSARYGRPDWRRAYLDTNLSKEIRDVNSLIPDIRIL